MAQVFGDYPRQLDLTYVHVWNGSKIIESSARLDCLKVPDKNSTGLDYLDQSAGLDYFKTPIKTRQSWTVLRPESIESIDKGDNKDLV